MTDVRDSRFDGLHAEATAAVGYSANTLRSVRERYHEAYSEALGRWQALRDELDVVDRAPSDSGSTACRARAPVDRAADAAEAGADDARRRALRGDVDTLTMDLGEHQAELAKLELAERTLERTWLFLERGDATLLTEVGGPATAGDLQMRIVEAQEAERSRLAQEIHDGPAQALSNAIFQVEYIERLIESDLPLARTELRFLRELLRRELGDVRAFISQLRPPLLDQLGPGRGDRGHRRTHADADRPRHHDGPGRSGRRCSATASRPSPCASPRRPFRMSASTPSANSVMVATKLDDDGWVLEVRDDGRGFDIGAVAARGRRNFGLQFMRERAELIGAQFDVRSRPDGGTVVRLAIPTEPAVGGEESR